MLPVYVFEQCIILIMERSKIQRPECEIETIAYRAKCIASCCIFESRYIPDSRQTSFCQLHISKLFPITNIHIFVYLTFRADLRTETSWVCPHNIIPFNTSHRQLWIYPFFVGIHRLGRISRVVVNQQHQAPSQASSWLVSGHSKLLR